MFWIFLWSQYWLVKKKKKRHQSGKKIFQILVFENICQTNATGPDTISGKILKLIWTYISDDINKILTSEDPSYPKINQGYYQRMIKKVVDAAKMKDFRPLGILNVMPKYFMNKQIFKQIRDHINPILNKRNNYSYKGTHSCIIKTLDSSYFYHLIFPS